MGGVLPPLRTSPPSRIKLLSEKAYKKSESRIRKHYGLRFLAGGRTWIGGGCGRGVTFATARPARPARFDGSGRGVGKEIVSTAQYRAPEAEINPMAPLPLRLVYRATAATTGRLSAQFIGDYRVLAPESPVIFLKVVCIFIGASIWRV